MILQNLLNATYYASCFDDQKVIRHTIDYCKGKTILIFRRNPSNRYLIYTYSLFYTYEICKLHI